MGRQCDGCTKCCSGTLSGEAHGHKFWAGRPCHFMGERGCTIYKTRPHDPCKIFECEWLANKDIPEWMKPNLANVLIVNKKINGVEYWKIQNAGGEMSVVVLSWLITYALSHQKNLIWNVGGGHYKLGSPAFMDATQNINNPMWEN